jgi:ATP-dependent DNA helicase RecG
MLQIHYLWLKVDRMTDNQLHAMLQEGEGFKTEFKERVANLDREITAFANSSGGSIFLGVDDANRIVGIAITNKLKSQVMDIARNCDPSIQIDLISHENNKVLELLVHEGADKPYRCRDGFFLRIGPSSQKLKRDEIISLIQHSGKIHFDESINAKFNYPADFSQSRLKDFLGYCGLTTQAEAENILLSLYAAFEEAEQLQLTNAGVLFFANEPQRFEPEAYITAVRYKTNDRLSILDKKDFNGSLVEQIENILNFTVRHMSSEANIDLSPRGTVSAARKDIHDYPLVALREALVNAVVHRDYRYDASHIYVHMYPNHIDIENPGGLHGGLTIENLGQRSVRRNRLIADLLHRAGFIERVGSGFDRMRHALENNNNPPMEISVSNFFNIRFYRRAKTTAELALSSRQMQIYYLFQEHHQLTKNSIAQALAVSGDTVLRELKILTENGLIYKSGTGKAIIYQIASIS